MSNFGRVWKKIQGLQRLMTPPSKGKMRERAELIGGKLNVWSAPKSGTEVDPSIAASRAYATVRAPGGGG